MTQCLCRPSGGFVRMTRSTGIGDFVFVRHVWGNELKRVGVYERAGHSFCFDFWHVTVYALAARSTGLMVRMLFQGRGVRAIR